MQYLTPESLLKARVVQSIQEANASFEPATTDNPLEVHNNEHPWDDTPSIKLRVRHTIGGDQNSDIGSRPGPEPPARSRRVLRRHLTSPELSHRDCRDCVRTDGNRYSPQLVDDKTVMPYSYPLTEKSLSGQGLMAFLAGCKCSPGEFRAIAGGEFVSKISPAQLHASLLQEPDSRSPGHSLHTSIKQMARSRTHIIRSFDQPWQCCMRLSYRFLNR